MKTQYKALSLLSGGLDSQLAVCVLRDQGVHVEGIIYSSPFFGPEKGEAAAQALGIPYHIIDFTEDILDRVQHPKHGIGGAMNPCIDCHSQMILRAGDLLEEWGFDFIATGEVLAQRPMSQNKRSLEVVARYSTYEDLLVRPLSAALLPPTKPIREGWIDVDKLPRFSGRIRTPQMELAKQFGITEFPTPAGGCLLTEKRFGEKLKDLLEHEGLDADRTNVWLLPTGRHIRLADEVKIIVGACKEDNDILVERARPDDFRITCPELPSPLTIAPANANKEQLKMAGEITARYARNPEKKPAKISVIQGDRKEIITVSPMDPETVIRYMITP